MDATGQMRHLLIAGCHSGNFFIVKTKVNGKQMSKETFENAHPNLIRVVVSLQTLRHRYFVSADVCGVVRVWVSEQ